MKVLGLDLGPASIGWALIEIDNEYNPLDILGLGSRVIPYSDDSIASDFSKGKGESACAERTRCRQMRRNIDRFQLHREQLVGLLNQLGIIDSDFKVLPATPLEVWKTRADAAIPGVRIPLDALARVLLHINHRRGYKHAKSDLGDSKQTDYVAKINDRYAEIKASGKTVGQYFYDRLRESEIISPDGKRSYNFRIKEQVCPRAAYEEEVDRILRAQSEFYPEILTDGNRKAIHQVIFYQRPLKSCKNLVSFCEFEKHEFFNRAGKTVESGPKVAPRTSPLEQVCRIYEAINNISLKNSRRSRKVDLTPSLFDDPVPSPRELRKLQPEYVFSDEERQRIFDYLNTHEKMSEKDLLKLLGLTADDGFKSDKALGKGIQGNVTRCRIEKALGDFPGKEALLAFDLTEEIPSGDAKADKETGEVIPRISEGCYTQPLYMLWHTLYSINDKDELFKVLSEKFGIDDLEILNNLYALDFVKAGYAKKSSKFIRKLIPLLRKGYQYSDACAALDVNHSNSLTKEENDNRHLQSRLSPILKGELRQPVVEKILNQTINVVNAIIDEYGEIDEVRIELARELKRDKEGREKMAQNMSKLERENKQLAEEIAGLNILPTRRRIQKLKMLKETGNRCMYCNSPITPYRFIEGHGYDIEHIIPRSRLFDDSFNNKVCACRDCNAAKGAMTAYDFMKGRTEQEFNSYIDRVDELYKANKISRTKRDRLMTSGAEIPEDFIERDLRETQYITKKAMEIMRSAIRNVYASSGMVTDFFKHAWGYDTILHDINLPRYEAADLTEDVEYESHGQTHIAHRIKDWSKRKDHRHHALDALVVALTRQGYIQRLNTLNGKGQSNQSEEWLGLDKWASQRPHILRSRVIDALESVAVSFKSGKKLTTPGKRYIRKNGKRVCVQSGITVPRAPLHIDSIYGQIKVYDEEKDIEFALNNISMIQNKKLRRKIESRLKKFNGDKNITLRDMTENPLIIAGKSVDKIGCYRNVCVFRSKIEKIGYKHLKKIVDPHIRQIVEERFSEVGNKDNAFWKSLADRPLYSDKECRHKIRNIRLFRNVQPSSVVAIRKNKKGEVIGYAQKQNNHHVAFYRNPEGKIVESVVSFWDCVKRKSAGIPVIIKDTAKAWDALIGLGDSEDAEELVANMPLPGSEFLMSFQHNEMVVLGMSDDEWNDAVAINDIRAFNRHLYRVWKFTPGIYCFKYHTNTVATPENGDKEIKQHYIISSISSLLALHPRKVKVSLLGKIILPSDDKENSML